MSQSVDTSTEYIVKLKDGVDMQKHIQTFNGRHNHGGQINHNVHHSWDPEFANAYVGKFIHILIALNFYVQLKANSALVFLHSWRNTVMWNIFRKIMLESMMRSLTRSNNFICHISHYSPQY